MCLGSTNVQRPHPLSSEHVRGGQPQPGSYLRDWGKGRPNFPTTTTTTDDPVSVLVQVGGRRALVLAQVAKLSAPGQSAPFSLPSSQAFSKSTTIEATVLQLLPVVGEAGFRLSLMSSCGSGMGGMWAASL
jgi:hypothetical protein